MGWPRWLKYGNWTGPGWSGGAWVRDPAKIDWSVPGKNRVDDLGKLHDWNTQHGDMPQWQADAIYIRGLWELNPQGTEENTARIMSLVGMVPACAVRWILGR